MAYNNGYLSHGLNGKHVAAVSVIPKRRGIARADKLESFEEFKELLRNLGADIKIEIIQKLESPDPAFFIGKGKARELAGLNVDIIAVDAILKPAQIANLRKLTKKEVYDREFVIIKIFAERATTREGKLEVELAELRYRMAKLIGIGREMSQLGGMPGTRGPGETKTEELRRHMINRIRAIEKELAEIKRTRMIHRERRKKQGFITFSLVGYTNVGKSTILRLLTQEDVKVKNQLFTTLETRIGLLKDSGAQNILISDTVGFIRNLPHTLVKAFMATLEEVVFSDVIIEVLDISSDYEKQLRTIEDVLSEINVPKNKPKIVVFNKIDLVSDEKISSVKHKFPSAIFISALKKKGIQKLKEEIEKTASIIWRGKEKIVSV